MAEGTSAALAAPAAAPAPVAQVTANTAPAAAPPAAEGYWLTGDELLVGFAQNKGWKTPNDAVTSYKHLESVIGADRAGRTVVMPKPDSTPEELSAFYTKLGRPENPNDYALPVPEGSRPEFAAEASKKFHELGLPKDQAQKLTGWMGELAKSHAEGQKAAQQAAFQADDAALKTEWGAAFEKNTAAAKAAVQSLGLDSASIDGISGAIGHKATMALLAKIGAKTLEDNFISGDRPAPFGDVMTPAQAKAQIDALKSDKDYQRRYFDGGAKEVAEMKRLQGLAYPVPPK
jgi:hypothetical protein